MRALFVVPRSPGSGHTGDRLRAELHLSALNEAGFETVLASVPPPGWRVAPALFRAAFSSDPLQSAFFAGDWRASLRGAGAMCDLAVVLLPARLWAHLGSGEERGRCRRLPPAPVVLDFVDALSEAARRAAARDPALWRRLYWRLEAPRLARAEAQAARGAAVLVATTPDDAAALPAGTRAIPNGVVIGPPPPREREPVVAFSGRLRYRPNEIAVRRLVRAIWPAVRRQVPGATLAIGGADAPAWLRHLDGREGISIVSPVADMGQFLREARVVAAPVELGTGTPNKLFEAFEAGAAVVASERVVARAGFRGETPPARTATEDVPFAEALADYLRDARAAAEDGARGRAWVEAHADRRRSVAALREIYREALGGGR